MDIRCDADNRPMFMEVNPLAGLHPKHSDLPIICMHAGISYKTLIQRIVQSAAGRVEQEQRSRDAVCRRPS
jgi:D-alanine-D-alanine ligase